MDYCYGVKNLAVAKTRGLILDRVVDLDVALVLWVALVALEFEAK